MIKTKRSISRANEPKTVNSSVIYQETSGKRQIGQKTKLNNLPISSNIRKQKTIELDGNEIESL